MDVYKQQGRGNFYLRINKSCIDFFQGVYKEKGFVVCKTFILQAILGHLTKMNYVASNEIYTFIITCFEFGLYPFSSPKKSGCESSEKLGYFI